MTVVPRSQIDKFVETKRKHPNFPNLPECVLESCTTRNRVKKNKNRGKLRATGHAELSGNNVLVWNNFLSRVKNWEKNEKTNAVLQRQKRKNFS